MERDIGPAYAGVIPPDKSAVESLIEQALASQGFERSRRPGDPKPSIVIVYAYGQANLDIETYDEQDPESGEIEFSSTHFYNGNEMARLVGLERVRDRAGFMLSSDVDAVVDGVRNDRAYLTLSALYADALAQKERKALWRTQISIFSLRNSLARDLPVMLASAAPFFGTETKLPVTVDDTTRREAKVELGDATVVPDQPAPARGR